MELNINSLQGVHVGFFEQGSLGLITFNLKSSGWKGSLFRESAASILASVKEQEARFERLTRALEEERRNVSLQLERANQPADRMSICCYCLISSWARERGDVLAYFFL
uniref:Uncharacterized protein n=1 Tax=Accipiter nisus TaxID=211598 RepID=A0A8B9N8X0_9AVES